MKTIILLLFVCIGLVTHAQQTIPAADTTIQFTVSGECAMCKERIEKAVKGKGVHSADWNIQSKILTLTYNHGIISIEKLLERINDAGHDTEFKKASDEAYNKLPDCCRYRTEDGNHEDEVVGVIVEEDEKGNLKPLKGATILLAGTDKGIATEENGFFSLHIDEPSVITVSYVGFQPKNVDVKPGDHLNIVLNTSKALEGIKVVSTRKSSYISRNVVRTQVMTERELFKAACCNLSESFETNPSVDVSYNDAVTGSKQIQLLGLSGNYTQLTMESLPGPRGLATPWGLNFIPGTWVESIQLSKGVGSVANGFESIAGQINVELKKPETSEQLFANAYVNNMGKTDLNLVLSTHAGKKWSTALLLHNAFLNNADIDFNKDGFRDQPTGNLFTVMNRWKYTNPSGVEGQIGFRILMDNKTGGETSFDPDKDKLTQNRYGLGIETKRYEAFGKIGYVFPQKLYKSIGLQVSTYHHQADSYFGTTVYNAKQDNIYANLIYQSVISNTNHKFRTGLSVVSDKYDELFKASTYKRTETVPGAFFEYTYTFGENAIIAGIRADHNNLFGFFITPRLHVRFEPVEGTTIRIAAGRGQRTANIFAENSGALVSSRQVNILDAVAGKAYGLNPEVAWNEGISIDQRFRLFNRGGSIGLDFFRTDFQNQVVADVDKTARQLNFYNLNGKSFSNSFQAELNFELIKKLELRLAYRYFDVKTTYHHELLQKPLLSKHRGFANLGYEVGKWKFDYTVTFNGSKRIPYTLDNPAQYQLSNSSPAYILMNAQVSRTLGKKHPVDIYVGSENMTNYFQDGVIVAADQPFGPYFDASMVWGPISGRMFYLGARFKLK